jgi:hypothetical protein
MLVGESELRVSKITTVCLGILAVVLGIAFEKENVAYMVMLAFAIACSANFPVLFMSVLWKNCTTKGAVVGGFVGLATRRGPDHRLRQRLGSRAAEPEGLCLVPVQLGCHLLDDCCVRHDLAGVHSGQLRRRPRRNVPCIRRSSCVRKPVWVLLAPRPLSRQNNRQQKAREPGLFFVLNFCSF